MGSESHGGADGAMFLLFFPKGKKVKPEWGWGLLGEPAVAF